LIRGGNMSEDIVSREACVEDVRRMARRTALLYYYFARTLIDELGEEEGKRLIAKAIWSYGEHCGRAARHVVEAMGLPTSAENFSKAPDLPSLGWETGRATSAGGETRPIATFCPLAAVWRELGAEELGRMYCYVDQAKYHAYNPSIHFEHSKNVLDGDAFCEFFVRSAE